MKDWVGKVLRLEKSSVCSVKTRGYRGIEEEVLLCLTWRETDRQNKVHERDLVKAELLELSLLFA